MKRVSKEVLDRLAKRVFYPHLAQKAGLLSVNREATVLIDDNCEIRQINLLVDKFCDIKVIIDGEAFVRTCSPGSVLAIFDLTMEGPCKIVFQPSIPEMINLNYTIVYENY